MERCLLRQIDGAAGQLVAIVLRLQHGLHQGKEAAGQRPTAGKYIKGKVLVLRPGMDGDVGFRYDGKARYATGAKRW